MLVLGLEEGNDWFYSTDFGATWTQGSSDNFDLDNITTYKAGQIQAYQQNSSGITSDIASNAERIIIINLDHGNDQTPVDFNVIVEAAAGPFISEVDVTVYNGNGNEIGSGDYDVATGQFVLSIGSYVGPFLVEVSDANGDDPDYIDETTNAEVSLGTSLRAMGESFGNGDVRISVTPLTELAARKAGISDDNEVSEEDVAVNDEVATLFGLDSITAPVDTIFDTDDDNDSLTELDEEQKADAARYGEVLAQLSGADNSHEDGGGIEATLAQLEQEIVTQDDGSLAMTQEGVEFLEQAVDVFESGVNQDLADLKDIIIKPPIIEVASKGINKVEKEAGVTVSISDAQEGDLVLIRWGEQEYSTTIDELDDDGQANILLPNDIVETSGDERVGVTYTLSREFPNYVAQETLQTNLVVEGTDTLILLDDTEITDKVLVTSVVSGESFEVTIDALTNEGVAQIELPTDFLASLPDGTLSVSYTIARNEPVLLDLDESPATLVFVDETPPAAPTLETASESDSGTFDDDNISNETNPIIQVNLQGEDREAPVAGDSLTLTFVSPTGEEEVSTVILTAEDIANGYAQVDTTGTDLGDDGEKTFSAIVTDQPGNPSDLGSFIYTLDTTPSDVTIDNVTIGDDTGFSADDLLTNEAAQTITASLSSELLDSDILYGSVDNGTTWTDITDSLGEDASTGLKTEINWDNATLQNGENSIQFKVTDLAGNETEAFSQDYNLDTQAPTTVIDIENSVLNNDSGRDDSDLITNNSDTGITLALSAALADDEKVFLLLDDVWVDITEDLSDDRTSLNTLLPAGEDTSFTYRITDAAGNSGEESIFTYTLDTTPVSAPSLTVYPESDSGNEDDDAISHNSAPTLTVSLNGEDDSAAEAGDTVTLTLDGEDVGSATLTQNDIDQGYALVTTENLGEDGEKVLSATIEDIAGNTSEAGELTYTLDSTASEISVDQVTFSTDSQPYGEDGDALTWDENDSLGEDNPLGEDLITDEAIQTISASLSDELEEGDTLLASLDGGDTWYNITDSVDGSSVSWAAPALNNGIDGQNELVFKVVDIAGNEGEDSIHAYELDTTAPTTTITGMTYGNDSGGEDDDLITNDPQSIILQLSTPLAAGDALLFNSGDSDWYNLSLMSDELVWSDSGDSVTVEISPIPVEMDDANTLSFKVVDAAGNSGETSAFDTRIDNITPDTPVITLSPDSDSVPLVDDNPEYGEDSLSNDSTPTLMIELMGEGDNAPEEGDTLTLSLSGEDELTSITLTQDHINAGQVEVTLSEGDLGEDGGKEITAQITDIAGNSSDFGGLSYTLDTAAPTQTIENIQLGEDTGNDGEDNVTNSEEQTIYANLSNELADDEMLYASIDGGTNWTNITNTIGEDASGDMTEVTWLGEDSGLNNGEDGDYQLAFKVIDEAGNEGTTATFGYELDITPSQAPSIDLNTASDSGISDTDDISNELTPTITVSLNGEDDEPAEVGDTLTLSLSGEDGDHVIDSITLTQDHINAGAVEVTLGEDDLGEDGDYELIATVEDSAGNISDEGHLTYTLDTLADNFVDNLSLSHDSTPFGEDENDTVVGEDNPYGDDHLTNAAEQTITATLNSALDDGDVLYGSTDGGNEWIDITDNVGGEDGTEITWDDAILNGGEDGSNEITFKVEDRAGNSATGEDSEIFGYELDTTAPTTTITDLTIGEDSGSSDSDLITNADWTEFTVTLDSALGDDEILLVGEDYSNGEEEGTFWLDASYFAPLSEELYTISDDRESVTFGFIWDYANDDDYNHNMHLKVVDIAGNEGEENSFSIRFDQVDPDAPVISLGEDSDTSPAPSDDAAYGEDGISYDITPTFNVAFNTLDGEDGAAEVGDTLTLTGEFINIPEPNAPQVGSQVGEDTISKTVVLDADDISNGYVDFTLGEGDLGEDGDYQFSSTITDIAGNTSSTDTFTYTLDTTDPFVTIDQITLSNDSTPYGEDFVWGEDDQGEDVLLGEDVTLGTSNFIQAMVLGGEDLTEEFVEDFMNSLDGEDVSDDIIDSLNHEFSLHFDNLTNDAEQDLTATLSNALADDESLYLSTDNGTSWQDVTDGIGEDGVSWLGEDISLNNGEDGTDSIVFKVVDAAGNEGEESSLDYEIDTSAPSNTVTSYSLGGEDTITLNFASALAEDETVVIGYKDHNGDLINSMGYNPALFSILDDAFGEGEEDYFYQYSDNRESITFSGFENTVGEEVEFFAQIIDDAGNKGESFFADTTAPDTSFSSAAYDATDNTLTLTGLNMDDLLSAEETTGEDLQANFDWSKLQWDIDSDNTDNISFTQNDIASVTTNADDTLTITLTDEKATALEGEDDFDDMSDNDSIEITAGFVGDSFDNVGEDDAFDSYVPPTVVAFDLTSIGRHSTEGNGINANSTTFDSSITYDIYIVVDQAATSGNTFSFDDSYQWDGGENLGSDDTVHLVSIGAIPDGNTGAAIAKTLKSSSNINFGSVGMASTSDAVAALYNGGSFTRALTGPDSGSQLWTGSWSSSTPNGVVSSVSTAFITALSWQAVNVPI